VPGKKKTTGFFLIKDARFLIPGCLIDKEEKKRYERRN
jgi:hypothetical protein